MTSFQDQVLTTILTEFVPTVITSSKCDNPVFKTCTQILKSLRRRNKPPIYMLHSQLGGKTTTLATLIYQICVCVYI